MSERGESTERAIGRLSGELKGLHRAVDDLKGATLTLGDKVTGLRRDVDRVRWSQFILGGLCMLAGGAVGGLAREWGVRVFTVAADLGDLLRGFFG